ncbi:MAG TPA: acyl-CoA reductase [Clostridiales bacterium UBA8960]|nr:acyl-CoA reductase [Clostridiales bacterium UBA8960]
MNLIKGRLISRSVSLNMLANLENDIFETIENTDYNLIVERTLDACDRLSKKISDDVHLPLLVARGMGPEKARRELEEIRTFLTREYLETRLKLELEHGGNHFKVDWTLKPFDKQNEVRYSWKPLGVLLHIAAGNIDALPVFSVIEGLLTGNINILKLPSEDDGLSVQILQELVELSPEIGDHIYVFDFSSSETENIRLLADVSDAIVVWGGEAAISAVRQLAAANTKIIEWGHKISFAYVADPENVSDADLEGIAFNMCDTEQLFCSSCQGIYIGIDDQEALYRFAERFHLILDRVATRMHGDTRPDIPVGVRAQKALERQTEQLESAFMEKRVYKSHMCSVIAYSDMKLTLSYQFGNCWVKRLPRPYVLKNLKPHKNRLQTMALLCDKPQRASLEALFLKAGVVRITSGQNMSKSYCGLPHDGEYPLRRYMKLISMD